MGRIGYIGLGYASRNSIPVEVDVATLQEIGEGLIKRLPHKLRDETSGFPPSRRSVRRHAVSRAITTSLARPTDEWDEAMEPTLIPVGRGGAP